MYKYKYHKIVEAGKIIDAVYTELYDAGTLFLDSGEMIDIKEDWIDKHDPMKGGYYVRYEDGYTSYSPADAFEKGYIRVEET